MLVKVFVVIALMVVAGCAGVSSRPGQQQLHSQEVGYGRFECHVVDHEGQPLVGTHVTLASQTNFGAVVLPVTLFADIQCMPAGLRIVRIATVSHAYELEVDIVADSTNEFVVQLPVEKFEFKPSCCLPNRVVELGYDAEAIGTNRVIHNLTLRERAQHRTVTSPKLSRNPVVIVGSSVY